MMRNVIRFVVFTVIFFTILIFLSFIYNDGSNTGFTQFYNEPRDSLDVLVFGASSQKDMWYPAVLWDEAGIRAYNFSSAGSPAVVQYYWLREALKTQSPSVVLLHGAWLFRPVRNSDSRAEEYRIRTGLDSMRFSLNKAEAICDILSRSEKQQFVDYLFPVLRYHSRSGLTQDDFDFLPHKQRNITMRSPCPFYLQIQQQSRPARLDEEKKTREYEIHDYYLQKFIDLCKENDIEVILVITLNFKENRWSLNRHRAMQKYADEQGVTLMDFHYGEHWDAIGIDGSTDFRNGNHLNIGGGTKTSLYMANYLVENFGLIDYREGEVDVHWYDVMDKYNSMFREYEEKLGRGPTEEDSEDVSEDDT